MQEYPKSTLGEAYFFLQGIGSLLGWNAVLTGLDYFDAKYPNYSPSFTFIAAVCTANILLSTFMVFIRKIFHLNFRISGCILFMGLILIALPIEAYYMANTLIGFIVIMVMIFIMACFNIIQQSSLAGIGSLFPSEYMAKYVLGTGIAGLLISLLRILILLGFTTDSNPAEAQLIGIFIYFGFSFIFAMVCIILHIKFINTEFCRYYLKKAKNRDSPTEILLAASELSKSITPNEDIEVSYMKDTPQSFFQSNIRNSLVKFFEVFNQIRYYSIFMIFVYIGTFMMFPGVTLLKKMAILNETWEAVLLITIFNLFDCIGKLFAGYTSLYNRYFVGIVVIFRFLLFIPFILMGLNLPNIPVISDDWFAFVNIALFGLTNGFPTSALFILGPNSMKSGDKEVGGFVMLFSLQSGIVCGTYLGLSFKNLGQ